MTQSSSGGNRGSGRRRSGGGNRGGRPSGNRNGGGNRGSSQSRQRTRKAPPKPTAWQKFVKFITFGAVDPLKSARKAKKPSGQQKPKQKRGPQKVAPTSGRLYVGNLDYGVEDSDLEDVFSKAGNVVNASVVRHGGSNRSKGFAFVEMASVEEAQKAVDTLNDLDLKGRKLLVSGAKSEKPEKSERPARERDSRSGGKKEPRKRERRERKPKFEGENDSRKVKVREIEVVTSPVVLLSGLNAEAEDIDISDLFSQIGSVQSREFADGSDGAATREMKVTMAETAEAQRAVDFLDGKSFMGYRLKVTGAPAEESVPTPEAPVSEDAPVAEDAPVNEPDEGAETPATES